MPGAASGLWPTARCTRPATASPVWSTLPGQRQHALPDRCPSRRPSPRRGRAARGRWTGGLRGPGGQAPARPGRGHRARPRRHHRRAPAEPPGRLRRRPPLRGRGRRDLADLDALRARRLFEPGTGYSYNNAAFSMAGALAEVVSGSALRVPGPHRLLRPLGMHSACFTADEAITRPVARPHWVIDGTAHLIRGAGWQPGWELGPVDRPAGGLVASVDDLLAWARFQWTGKDADGNELLPSARSATGCTPRSST